MAEPTETQRLVEQLLEARNELGRAALQLEALLATIRGDGPPPRPEAPRKVLAETRFVPAIRVLSGEVANYTKSVAAYVDALDRLL